MYSHPGIDLSLFQILYTAAQYKYFDASLAEDEEELCKHDECSEKKAKVLIIVVSNQNRCLSSVFIKRILLASKSRYQLLPSSKQKFHF